MEGQKSTMSMVTNKYWGLFGIFLSHAMIELVFFHWFNWGAVTIFELIRCSNLVARKSSA